MIPALLTGSRVYGEPKDDSDLDLVLLVTDKDIDLLRAVANEEGNEYDAGDGKSVQFRFGYLNVICVTDPVAFAVFEKGTRKLKRFKTPVSREIAVAVLDSLRQHHGILQPGAEAGPTRKKTKKGKKSREDEIPF